MFYSEILLKELGWTDAEVDRLRVLVERTVTVRLNENVRLSLDPERVHFFDMDTTLSLATD